jgi:hypothetical protein
VTSTSICSGIAAVVLYTVGNSGRNERHRSVDLFGRIDALQVGREHATRDGMALHVAHDRRTARRAVDGDGEQMVLAAVCEQVVERFSVDGHGGRVAVAVEHRGDGTGAAQRFGRGRAGALARRERERIVGRGHDGPLITRGAGCD